jgi:hypothetical protein
MLCRSVDEREVEQHRRNLTAYGYTKIAGAMLPDALRHARERIAEIEDQAISAGDTARNDGGKTSRLIFNVQNLGKFFVDLIAEKVLLDLCMPFLNDPYYGALPPDVPNYVLGYYTARSSQENTPLPLHIDSIIPAPGDRTWAMQAVFMLNDQTRSNGCTVVVPGSHHSGNYTDRELDLTVPVESRAGDLVVWDSRLWHGALPNREGAPRWALIATFHMWWLKQKMDIPRILPQDIYASLSDLQKQLLGYCALPPTDHTDNVNTKRGYDVLKPRVADYYR